MTHSGSRAAQGIPTQVPSCQKESKTPTSAAAATGRGWKSVTWDSSKRTVQQRAWRVQAWSPVLGLSAPQREARAWPQVRAMPCGCLLLVAQQERTCHLGLQTVGMGPSQCHLPWLEFLEGKQLVALEPMTACAAPFIFPSPWLLCPRTPLNTGGTPAPHRRGPHKALSTGLCSLGPLGGRTPAHTRAWRQEGRPELPLGTWAQDAPHLPGAVPTASRGRATSPYTTHLSSEELTAHSSDV